VGEDIRPGTYRSDGGGTCYRERLRDLTGGFKSIIANGLPQGPAIVTIVSTDKAFSTQGCGTWTLQ
jgi:hypothetical protein